VLRTVCSLYFNEIQRLSSAYNTLPWYTSYTDVKRTFWSFFTSLLSISFVVCVCFYCVFLHVLPSGVIKID